MPTVYFYNNLSNINRTLNQQKVRLKKKGILTIPFILLNLYATSAVCFN